MRVNDSGAAGRLHSLLYQKVLIREEN